MRVKKREEVDTFFSGWIEGGPPFLSMYVMCRSSTLSTYGLKLPFAFSDSSVSDGCHV